MVQTRVYGKHANASNKSNMALECGDCIADSSICLPGGLPNSLS